MFNYTINYMYFRHYLRYNICIKTKNRKKGQKTPRRIVVQLKNGVFLLERTCRKTFCVWAFWFRCTVF